MIEVSVGRFLDFLRDNLGAVDARIEVGGRPPADGKALFHDLGGARVVVLFEEVVESPDAARARLISLCSAFTGTVEGAVEGVRQLASGGTDARAELDAELTALASRAEARRAVVCDLNSPIIWGASTRKELLAESREKSSEGSEALEQWVGHLRESQETLLSSRGHVIRMTVPWGGGERECLAKLFGGIYIVSLVFDGRLSEPVAVGALLHAASRIEKLVMSLPPLEPPPGGKVIRLSGRLRRL